MPCAYFEGCGQVIADGDHGIADGGGNFVLYDGYCRASLVPVHVAACFPTRDGVEDGRFQVQDSRVRWLTVHVVRSFAHYVLGVIPTGQFEVDAVYAAVVGRYSVQVAICEVIVSWFSGLPCRLES